MNRTFDSSTVQPIEHHHLPHPESLHLPNLIPPKPRPIWVMAFLAVSLLACVLGAVLVPTGLGFLVGYQELQAHNHESAIQHFQRGLGFLAENYPELAYTEFQVAAKYDPNYEPAVTKVSEMSARFGGVGTAPKTQEQRIATALLDEAQDLIAQKQWGDAILRLEQLRALNPGATSGEAVDMLYQAYVSGGKDAVAIGQVQLARERFESALAIKNTDPEVVKQRDLAVLYLDAQMAVGINWQTAIQKFTVLYQQDPNYDDVKVRLADAHVKYGDVASKTSPCLAAREYDSAASLVKDPSVDAKRVQAQQACKQAITNPPTPTPLATQSFTWKVFSDNSKACTGTGDVSGTVTDQLAQPMVGISVGYYADGIPLVSTKTNAEGKYQLAWGKDAGLFRVVILGSDGKTPIGLSVDVQYPGGNNPACHWVIDWQKVQ